MKVILVMVMTVNGRITRGDDPHIATWTSEEDHDFFVGMLQKHNLIVMGSGTYEAARKQIKPDNQHRRIIITSDPARYIDDVEPGAVEFTNETPSKLVERLEKEGHDTLLLVGGGETNRYFFEAGLVSDLFVTVEPRLFGKGRFIVGEGNFDPELQLVSVQKLNAKGSLLLHYEVVK